MKVEDLLRVLDEIGIDYNFSGRRDIEISGFSSLYHYQEGTITWLRDATVLRSDRCAYSGTFSCIVTGRNISGERSFYSQIAVEDPRKVFFMIVDSLWGQKTDALISPKAEIETGALIGEHVGIGAFTFISAQAVIGNNTMIGTNVTILGKTTIGSDCMIQSGAVIGDDGFAFVKEPGKLIHVPHYAGVRIGNNVSVGANTCIARGTIDDTVIKDDAKIDNLCHIAHNVVVGERVEIIAGTVVMGSVQIGDDTWVATSIIRDQRKIGKNALIGMGSVVISDIADGITVVGNPATVYKEKEQ